METDSVIGLVQSTLDNWSQDRLQSLTRILVNLVESSTSSSTATVTLYSVVHSLVNPIVTQQHDLATIANYLIQHFVPALNSTHIDIDSSPTSSDELNASHFILKEQFQDVLIDVVWQFGEEIDSGLINVHQSQPVDDNQHDDKLSLIQHDNPDQQAQPSPNHEMDVDQKDNEPLVQIPAKSAEELEQEQAVANQARVEAEQAQRLKEKQSARERLGQFVKLLVTAGVLSADVCLDRLEVMFLSLPSLQLISPAAQFPRLEIRARTALYYKQQKFNLLREESEGYAKLAVEVLASMGPPHRPDGSSAESARARMQRATNLVLKVESLIGNFDLDPDRTLDIVLDAFSDELVQHYRFFLDFLSASPWAPRAKLLEFRARLAKAQTQESDLSMDLDEASTIQAHPDKGKAKDIPIDIGLDKDEGKRLIAQILGFKFAYYQTEGAEGAPDKLYLLAALLIQRGFVKFGDLWLHLSPDDQAIVKIDTQYRDEQEKLARSVGGANALAMAGALVDDDVTIKSSGSASAAAANKAAAPPSAPRELPNQKLGLLRALLVIGDMTHSLFILAQYPYLVPAHPDLADLLNRILAVAIEPAYDTISLAFKQADYQPEYRATRHRYVAPDKQHVPKPVKPALQLTASAVPDPNRDLVFFLPSWQRQIPRAGDWDEVLDMLEEMYLPLIGVFVSRDFSLFTKICRIIVNDLGSNIADHPRLTRWIDIVRQFLLPSISLLEHHTAAALELWRVLSLLPIEKRFQLYGEWKDTLYRRIPALAVRKAEAERDVKSILRRLSTENVKKLGKTLAKAAHTNPTITFGVALNQVQSYDNLIVPVVEAARYLTDFGYDVLTFSLLDALATNKSKTKEDGTSVSLWLQGLATFAGQLYRRWAPMAPSLWIVIQYLVNQLASGDSKDLVVLRELITRMTGIEPFADLSDAQVMSLAGGAVLRSEVFSQTELTQTGVGPTKKVQVASTRERLTMCLKRSGLAVPLLVNIALQRKACTATEAHLKSLGALYDQNHAVLFQYMEYLSAVYSADELASIVPSVVELLTRYKLDPAIAFDIARPRLRLAMRAHDEREIARAAEQKKRMAIAARLALEKDAAKKQQEVREKQSSIAQVEEKSNQPEVQQEEKQAAKQEDKTEPGMEVKVDEGKGVPPAQADVAMDDIKVLDVSGVVSIDQAAVAAIANGADVDTVTTLPPAPASPRVASSPWHPGLIDVIDSVVAGEILPAEVQGIMGTPFFVTFWQLTLYDIVYPKERYDAEFVRLTALQREASASSTLKPDDKDRFTKNVIDLAKRLAEEASHHALSRNATSRRLLREAKHWFAAVPHDKKSREALALQIYQYCIQPRAKLSLPDAAFCYAFIKRLHSSNTLNFHTLVLFDKILTNAVGVLMFSCSENEARNFARFLYDMLSDVQAWYKSEDAYKGEAIGNQLVGFTVLFPTPTTPTSELRHLPYDLFLDASRKWHKRLAMGFIAAFKSGEYMHIKNSILVLTKIAPVFPTEYDVGSDLDKAVTALIAKETREDLKILAQGYKAVLSKRRKSWLNQPKPAIQASPAPSKAPTPATSSATSITKAAAPVTATTSQSESRLNSVASPARASLSSSVSASAAAVSNNVPPTEPKYGLPARPGHASAANSAASSPRTMDSRPPIVNTTTSSATELDRRPAQLRRTDSASSGLAHGSSSHSNASLPPRPGGPTNASVPVSGSHAEKLRQEALSSRDNRRGSGLVAATPTPATASRTAMDPPTTTRTERAPGAPSEPSTETSAARNALSSTASASVVARTSGDSRPASPRGSDSGRRSDRDRDRERDRDKDKDNHRDRSSRKHSRERSVESTHLSSKGPRRDRDGGDRETGGSHAVRSSRRDERDRDREGHRRSDRHSERDRESRSERSSRRDEERTSSRRDGDSSRTSSRRDKTDEHRSSSRRDDDRRRSDRDSTTKSPSKDVERSSTSARASAEPRAPRTSEETTKESDDRIVRPAPAQRDVDREPPVLSFARDGGSRDRSHAGQHGADAPPPSSSDAVAPSASATRSEVAPSVLSIKGGGTGASRVFGAALGSGRSHESAGASSASSDHRRSAPSRDAPTRDVPRDAPRDRDDRFAPTAPRVDNARLSRDGQPPVISLRDRERDRRPEPVGRAAPANDGPGRGRDDGPGGDNLKRNLMDRLNGDDDRNKRPRTDERQPLPAQQSTYATRGGQQRGPPPGQRGDGGGYRGRR